MKELARGALVPIRCRGVLHFYASRDPRPCLVVTAPRVSPVEARERLANMARAHRLAAGDHVPGVVDECLDGPSPWVMLDCEAIADGDHVADYTFETGVKSPHSAGAALIVEIMKTIARVHGVTDPATGTPVCLGSLARANILFAADGRMWLLCGAGHLADAFIAPEVACGGPTSTSADVYSMIAFLRGQIAITDMHPAIQRVFAGRMEPGDEMFAQLVATAMRIQSMTPAERPPMPGVIEQTIGAWRKLGFALDYAEYAMWVSRALAAGPERLAAVAHEPEPPCIRLGRDGEWLETPNGMRHSLRARRPLRRVLLALAEARRDRAGVALMVDDLLQAGWPGETPLPEAGSNRVYVAVSSLRQLGLNDLLQRWDGGYRLDPAMRLQIEESGG